MKPKLLSPCGSFDSLYAALCAGADEVYFGMPEFNARINAKNFDKESFKEALSLCRLYGVKSNITLNTLILDKELNEVKRLAYEALCNGADAFIVQDLGLAKALKESFPNCVLHASTQCACHNTEGAKYLKNHGFSRIVLARELSKTDIFDITKNAFGSYETEVFIHGALCVSHSGMCLMSSCIGKRSGNRGQCAQPCRLKYSIEGKAPRELLSLKDLCLAGSIKQLCDSGIASLKIEGRMKSPEYVYGVTKIYRKLLDEERNANTDEIEYLKNLFSRGGFTDGYYSESYKKSNASMYGVRGIEEKAATRELESKESHSLSPIAVGLEYEIKKGNPIQISLRRNETKIKYISDVIPSAAKSRPIDIEFVKKCLLKTGDTYFCIDSIKGELEDGLFLTAAMLNSARRGAIECLTEKLLPKIQIEVNEHEESISVRGQTRDAELIKSDGFIYPLSYLKDNDLTGKSFAVELPRVIFNDELSFAKMLLKRAKAMGAKFALIHNVSQIEICKAEELTLFGGIGLNVFNSKAVEVLENDGFYAVTLSCELNPPQMRDIATQKAKKAVLTEARLPLMVLESCAVRASSEKCPLKKGEICNVLKDRIGADFPVLSQERFSDNPYPCRNIILNSVVSVLSHEKIEKIQPDIIIEGIKY